MSTRVLIVDDEPLARRKVRRLLAEEDVEVVGECESGDEVVRALEELRPDLLFFDVQIRGLTAFEVIERVGAANMPPTIFVTAYDDYALRAFDVEAVDYLLKPIGRDRFRRAVRRALAHIDHARAEELLAAAAELPAAPGAGPAAGGQPAEWLVVRTNTKALKPLQARDIDWIEAAGNYVFLHVGEVRYLYRATVSMLEAALDPGRFVRIHRSTIVNLHSIESMDPMFAGDYSVKLKSGRRIKLSRTYRDALERRLGRAG